MIAASIVPSVQGFFRSIRARQWQLAAGHASFADAVVQVWSPGGCFAAVSEGFASVIVDTWLEVIPQIIARITAPSPRVRSSHPQFAVRCGVGASAGARLPADRGAKSPSHMRIQAAMGIMENVREHSPVLVEQALLVSNELIRVAILWHEMWHEGLEEASRLYFTEHNIRCHVCDARTSARRLWKRDPRRCARRPFAQTHGRDLAEARECGRRFRQYGDNSDLNQAWDLYYHVFKKITKQVPAGNSVQLDLQYVSPKLLAMRDLELAVPERTNRQADRMHHAVRADCCW